MTSNEVLSLKVSQVLFKLFHISGNFFSFLSRTQISICCSALHKETIQKRNSSRTLLMKRPRKQLESN